MQAWRRACMLKHNANRSNTERYFNSIFIFRILSLITITHRSVFSGMHLLLLVCCTYNHSELLVPFATGIYPAHENIFCLHPTFSYRWLMLHLSLGYHWLMLHLFLGYRWLMLDLSLGYRSLMLGLSLAYPWVMLGLSWLMLGLCLGYAWLIVGLCFTASCGVEYQRTHRDKL